MSSQRRKLTENAQTADVHGPGPRPAVELPIWRLNALAPRPVRKPVTGRRADDSTGTSSGAKRVLAPRTTPGGSHFSDNAVFCPVLTWNGVIGVQLRYDRRHACDRRARSTGFRNGRSKRPKWCWLTKRLGRLGPISGA